MQQVVTPRDANGIVDHDIGWKLWSDMVRYYPSGVHRRRLVADWVAPLAPATILDAGCGPGHMLDYLRRRVPSAQHLVGVDHSSVTVAENRRRLPWGRFETVDLGVAALPERFELVVCSEVLEHIPDGEAGLAHLVAMTGRYLMLTVPTGPLYPLEAGFGHFRHYVLDELVRAVEKHGLTVRRAEAWGFPFMTAFKATANLMPQQTMNTFGAGAWSWPKKAVGALLTGLFYLNVPRRGPQLLLLAERA